MGDLEYQLVYSRRKSISIAVNRQGQITVRAPLRESRQSIERFLKDSREWIAAKKAKMERQRAACPDIEIREGGRIPFLGGELTIHMEPHIRIRRMGECLLMPEDATGDQLVRFLKREARPVLQESLDHYAQLTGLRYREMKLSSARGRWGSCSHDNSINLTWRLIFCPIEAIDYVAVHELCHILHKNHSREFWASVERVLPDYRERERWLKDHARLMDIL